MDCARKNLAALTRPSIPPTRGVNTECRAQLADRFGHLVGLPTQVGWLAERGYTAGSNSLPNDTVPLTTPSEPVNGMFNPRDTIISIIAVVDGEEEFTDVNANGKWDPGEWFVDLPEPFVDDNDNQKLDIGEQFLDTDRFDCVTGAALPRNSKWDPPNGCWDVNLKIFATTHVAWTGAFARPIEFALPPPWTVAAGTQRTLDFTWSDPYFNQMSIDGPSISTGLIGSFGGAAINAPTLLVDGLGGHTIVYEKVEATESAAGSGVFNVTGPCITSQPGPTNPLTRCLSRYRFSSFGRGNAAQLVLTGQGPFPDGGVPPATSATIRITGQSLYFPPVAQQFTATFE